MDMVSEKVQIAKGLFISPTDCMAPGDFWVPDIEFFRNLVWILWVPIRFNPASIEDLGLF